MEQGGGGGQGGAAHQLEAGARAIAVHGHSHLTHGILCDGSKNTLKNARETLAPGGARTCLRLTPAAWNFACILWMFSFDIRFLPSKTVAVRHPVLRNGRAGGAVHSETADRFGCGGG